MADIGELAALLAQLWVMSVELNPHGFWGPCLAGLWAQAPQVFHPELVAGDFLAAGQLADSGLVKLPPFVASDPALSPDRCPQPRCLRLRLPLRAWGGCGGPGGLLHLAAGTQGPWFSLLLCHRFAVRLWENHCPFCALFLPLVK